MFERFLITGVTSIHGYPIYKYLSGIYPSSQILAIRSPKMKVPADDNVIPLCITDETALKKIGANFLPTHIIHCAGVCDLDVCEERPEWAYAMNTTGSQKIAEIFENKSKIIYMSSDLVFSGKLNSKNGYTEECIPDPVSVAGKTIAEAEHEIQKCTNHTILRLGLPIGDSVTGDKGAIDFIDSRLKKNLPVTLFHDEWRSCISCEDIFRATLEIIHNDLRGVYHLGGPQKFSLFDIGAWVLKKNDYNPKYLKGILRSQEKNGPPRMGDVSLNSIKLQNCLSFQISNPLQN